VGPAPFFLFVGKRSKRRNVAAILDAFRLHLRSHPDHRLVFVGPDAPDSATLEREPGVVVAGHVEEEILHGLMPGAVALLYPSEYEGFGLPVLEALASGCPVIALANSALPEAGGAAAWYLESAQPELMAETMRRVWNDRDERERRIALGLNHAATLNQARFAEAVKHELVAAAAVEVERSRTDAARSGSRRAQGR
jgi:alpha-1,3-rhamnosyl/mannosyltransferase